MWGDSGFGGLGRFWFGVLLVLGRLWVASKFPAWQARLERRLFQQLPRAPDCHPLVVSLMCANDPPITLQSLHAVPIPAPSSTLLLGHSTAWASAAPAAPAASRPSGSIRISANERPVDEPAAPVLSLPPHNIAQPKIREVLKWRGPVDSHPIPRSSPAQSPRLRLLRPFRCSVVKHCRAAVQLFWTFPGH